MTAARRSRAPSRARRRARPSSAGPHRRPRSRAVEAALPTTLGTGTGGGPELITTRTCEPSSTRVPGAGSCAIATPAGASEWRSENSGCTCNRLARACTPPRGSLRSSGTFVFAAPALASSTATSAAAAPSTSASAIQARRRRGPPRRRGALGVDRRRRGPAAAVPEHLRPLGSAVERVRRRAPRSKTRVAPPSSSPAAGAATGACTDEAPATSASARSISPPSA